MSSNRAAALLTSATVLVAAAVALSTTPTTAAPAHARPPSVLAAEVQQVAPQLVLTRAARRTVTYHVETRGKLRADPATFRRQAQQTFDHALGWERAGLDIRRVARRGQFTLVLAEASWLPRFSSACSREWSCRVGRYVVINETRWRKATELWNRKGGTLRAYRHLVVNHETGHWLGLGHRGCPRRGVRAPVMQPQSKGLYGCRINPFPKRGEVAAVP